MALTKKQLEWLETRTRGIIVEQLRKYEAALPELPVFGFAEKVAAIRAGKAKLRPTAEMDSCTALEDAYTYPTAAPILKKRTERREKIRAYENALQVARNHLLDKAIMGDAKEALAALDSFTAQIAKIKT